VGREPTGPRTTLSAEPFAMNFSLPKEFEQFVTSAEDLLKQFDGNLSNESVVNVSIHWHERNQSCPQFESAMRYHRLLNNQLEELSRGYVWHDEPFRFVISFDYKGVASLTGSAKIGECVDDEWFIVYLVLQISKAFPELIISVTDNDDQFMLMEAADHIDDWLGPENADNRVWIKEGLVHIIPYDEPGKLKSGGMKLNSALQCMFGATRTGVTLASEAFQRAIRARTTGVYPAKALADGHTAMCVVPHWLSEVLQRHPNIVSRAVAAFCAADKDTLRKACTVVTTSNSTSVVTSTATKLAMLTSNASWVAVPVRFTRALYAQLTFKDNFNPPRKYHSVMRRMAAAQSRKVTHAFELGCRLACGIDCALYACRSDKVARGSVSDAVWQEVLTVARKDDYLSSGASTLENTARMAELRRLFEERQLMSAANLETHRAGDSAYPEGFAAFLHRELSAAQSGALVNTVKEAADTEHTATASEEQHDAALFRAVHEGLPRCDGDDWLYLSPEELDRELQQRLDRFKGGTQSENASASAVNHSSTASTAGSQSSTGVNSVDTVNGLSGPDTASASDTAKGGSQDAAQLQRMLDGLKSFMAGTSDLDGVTPTGSKSAAKSMPSAKQNIVSPIVGPAVASDEAAVSGGLQLDYSLLNSLMQSASLHADGTTANAAVGVSAPERVAHSASLAQDTTPADNAAPDVADDLAQYFTNEDLNDAQNGDSDDDSDDDNSDNEDEDQQGAVSADKYLQQIFAENAQRGNNSVHPSSSAANRASGTGEGLVSKEPNSVGAVLGVGGGILRSGSGVACSGDVFEAIDSDDEIVEVAPTTKSAAKPTSAAAAAAATQAAQQKTRPVTTAGNGTAGMGAKPLAAECAPWGDDSDDSDDMDGDGVGEEEDWDAKYDSLDPQTIREFQVRKNEEHVF
jgi:hypothetical protein